MNTLIWVMVLHRCCVEARREHDRNAMLCRDWRALVQRDEYWRACTRKPNYKRREDAEMAMRAVAPMDKGLNAYQCNYCGMWHKGH